VICAIIQGVDSHSPVSKRLTALTGTQSIEKQAQLAPNAELVALVRPMPDDPSGTFTHALELLASIQTSPSCNRIAASTLLDSCHSIEGSEHDVDASIEDLRSIYAAQLAMCEIGSANSVKPQSCGALTTAAKTKSKGARSISKDELSKCLRSLESRPQWWTSYSNNRQNAGVMCQAARMDIEKGKGCIFQLTPALTGSRSADQAPQVGGRDKRRC